MASDPRSSWVVPDAEKVTYVTDVEGHWEYFCNYVSYSNGLKFKKAGDQKKARQTPELELQDGWHFVFGGDSCDKGPGTLRFLEAMVTLKKRYPDRVHLLMGNRDINKIRWTSEFTEEYLKSLTPETPGPYWVVEKDRKKPWWYLKQLAKAEDLSDEEAKEKIQAVNTAANRFRFHLKYDMGSDGEFEFRRKELALMQEREEKEISDEEVVKSYLDSVGPGGLMRDYLLNSELAIVLGDTLFVHGQIIGNQFFSLEKHEAWSVKVVPKGDGYEIEEDLRKWVCRLNEWAREQIQEWIEKPTWDPAPTVPTYEGFRGRGGHSILAYGTPMTQVPSVVYCRWLEQNCMPKPYPQELVDYLGEQNIARVIVGHTPHGNCPTVIPNGPKLSVIMADTSYSHMFSKHAYEQDNRGDAACDVVIEGKACRVKGRTGFQDRESGAHQVLDFVVQPGDDADPMVGRRFELKDESETKEAAEAAAPKHPQNFFVKARLTSEGKADTRYLLCKVDGFLYTYQEESQAKVCQAVENSEPGIDGVALLHCARVSSKSYHGLAASSDQRPDSLEEIQEKLFLMMDRDGDKSITKQELLTSWSEKDVRAALQATFPEAPLEEIFAKLDTNKDGKVSWEEFFHAVQRGS